MKSLFNLATYKDAHITCPDQETIVVDGVRGTGLVLKFEKEVDGWAVRVRVTGTFKDKPQPNHVTIMSGCDLTEDIKKFWTAVRDYVYQRDTQQFEERQREALAIIEGKHKK